jgi:site-specific DNA recombinase
MSTYFLYARKSTDDEDRQVRSIESQLHELREQAARDGLKIVAELIEKQSAKKPGRPIFNDMMDRIEAGEAQGILAWHPDRLSRNGVDGGRITYALDGGKLTSLKFSSFWFENTPQGKFMLNMAFSQSKYYVDALSENTKRGLREKVRRGEYPGPAPFGYLNDYRSKTIIIDRERADMVKEMFERYSEEIETLDTLQDFLAEHGVLSSEGKRVGRSYVSRILTNPFYYGHFRYAGEVHEGKHEPIIAKKLFDEVQGIMAGRARYRKATRPEPKVFTGLLRCATCGMMITAEHKVKRQQNGNVHHYTYYHCTKKNRSCECSQPSIQEHELDAELTALLKPYSLPDDWADAMLKRVKEDETESAQSSATLASQKRAEIEKLNGRLQRLLDSFLDGVLEREEYTAEKAKLMSRKKSLQGERDDLAQGQAMWIEPLKEWILTAKNAGEIAMRGSSQEKKALAQQVFGSNLVLDCKKARGCSVKPWSSLVENSSSGGMVGWRGLEPRTNALKGHCSTN